MQFAGRIQLIFNTNLRSHENHSSKLSDCPAITEFLGLTLLTILPRSLNWSRSHSAALHALPFSPCTNNICSKILLNKNSDYKFFCTFMFSVRLCFYSSLKLHKLLFSKRSDLKFIFVSDIMPDHVVKWRRDSLLPRKSVQATP